MLSFLIPTRDYTCYSLVRDLHEQAERTGVEYEIIVAEDGSRSQVDIIANHKITDLSHCRHLVRRENVGAAQIRNLLAKEARHEWIVFIDSDAKVEKEDFVQTYINYVGKADVIVGGMRHQDTCADPHRSLRFRYEKVADKQRSAAIRSLHPYDKFTTFNFMMRRSTFLCILFDAACKEYGYEDALFGVELKRRNIGILHVENPLTHTGLDTNQVFIQKSETALRTLNGLKGKMEGQSHVGRAYDKLRKLHLAPVAKWGFRLFRRTMLCNLMSSRPSLTIFSLYKLGYYAGLK